ncbi:circularly permuted type 2 ATP-grasp protein [Nocardia takedensis]|uniref:circularly permuted type 2 ATP-grasp protein n=1 Tax=Nocardia takedensis TaxID=259390 RepID=UPI003570AC90
MHDFCMTSASPPRSGRPSVPNPKGANGQVERRDRAVTSGLFEGYKPGRYAGAFDEMFDASGRVRAPYRGIFEALAPIDVADLERRSDALDRAFIDQGITFSLSGQERPFPLDLVPRVIAAAEWTKLERGIKQRVVALELFLADVYGEQNILRDQVIPKRLVTSCQHFHREAAGLVPPNGVRIHVAGIDLIRDERGDFRVLEDNLRSPSGVSYVMENRRTMARVFPDLFFSHRVRAVGDYPAYLLRALRNSAAPNEADPTVVVLTPGVYNAAYFEHSLLARQMGVELVEGRDLFCRDNFVYMRTTEGERQVDVIYRRIDDTFLDPMHFRPDSVLGIAGVLNAARAGNVVISSAVGNGVGDDKLIYAYVPTIIEYYLNEKPVLPNVDTFRCWLPEECEEVLDRLEELVIKPVEGSGGYGIVIGPDATQRELDAVRRKVKADPRGWIAQPVVQLSTVPTKIGNELVPRHVDLRPFAVNDGDDIWVLPGGLTRVALPEGSLVVNSSQGGGSKDTWVLTGRASPEDRELAGEELVGDPPQSDAFELGRELTATQANQQQQQQQQEQRCSEPGASSRDEVR